MRGPGKVVASIPAGAAVDIASNANQASTSVDNLVTYDPVAPTVTINQASDQPAPTNTSPIRFTAVFSEVVSGSTGTDVSFAGSTAPGALVAQVSGGPATYTVSVSGMTGPGTVVASIPAGVAVDIASNPNQGSTSVDNLVTYDPVAPTVTINQASDQPAP